MAHIESYKTSPIETQKNVFFKIIHQAKHTEYGKKYDFKSIHSLDSFKERVPALSYESIFPYIERVMKGESDVLWPGKINWFAKSSGTTNAKSKFIPVSDESLHGCHYKGGKDLIAMYFGLNPESKMFDGKGLAIGGTYRQNEYNPQSYYGDVSAVIMANLPKWASFASTPSRDISLMANWEQKLELMSKTAAKAEVSNISGVPTWAIVLLEKVLHHTDKKNLLEVWPKFEVFFHGAIAFEPYEKLFHEFFPSNQVRYMETYNASEGFFAIRDSFERDDMLLMLDNGIYYEFLPLAELNNEQPNAISLEDVKIGVQYAMVISTNAGLWRYLIGDTVYFTSLYPFRIKISGRTKHFINAFGEELVIENAEKAIAMACQATSSIIQNYTVAPIYMNASTSGAHEWAIEFIKEPEQLEAFVKILDNELKKVNSDYEAKRHKNYILQMPILRKVNNGTFLDWLKLKNKLSSQSKIPRLSNDRTFIEEILQLSDDKG